MAKSTDFRYNTGDTRVPWPAVGENYNVQDLMAIIRFLMKASLKRFPTTARPSGYIFTRQRGLRIIYSLLYRILEAVFPHR